MLLILTSLTLMIPLADEFAYVIKSKGKIKHMSLYHQRRFAKLVYLAASAPDLLQMLLHETEKK